LSAGATTELEALRVALVSDGDAMTTVMSDRAPGEILTQLEGRPTAVGTAMRAYLAVVGLRVVGGYDVADRHGRERPDLLVNIIRAAVTAVYSPTQGREAEQAIASIRARVPEAHRVEFDALLAEALLTYRVRDERNFCSDAIGVGALRRALLAVGSRLQAEGRVHAPEHLVDASEAEVIALLGGSATPSADELAARFTRRMATTLADAPDRLGFEPSGPPPADWLPPGAARTQRAVDLVLNLMFAVPPKSNSATRQLKGFGVSPGVYEGPVRVISDVTQLGDVQAGEILVTSSTGPTFNIILPLLKAIVTERGGALSHAAIVAREYGIPAIVGCPGAMAAVKTGSRIKVDGTKGEMWVLD
jgi:pyruvate,water dikinase